MFYLLATLVPFLVAISLYHTARYWRAAVLDGFARDRWLERPARRGDALAPAAAHDPHRWVRQDVTVKALSDTRLVAATMPESYAVGDATIVRSLSGGASLPSGLTSGLRYTAWSYAPQPRPAQLARSRPTYPRALVERNGFYKGATLSYFAFAFIPRFLWPAKPQIAMGEYGRGWVTSARTSSNQLFGAVLGDNGVQIGTPFVSGAKVLARVLSQGKGEKLVVFKYKPKKRYRRKTGHRQRLTTLAIREITV